MCHQSVGLIQAVLEERGIATVSVSVCEEITARIGPPRVLEVPFPFGYPLGRPNDPALQSAIVRAALKLFAHPGPPPVSERFVEAPPAA